MAKLYTTEYCFHKLIAFVLQIVITKATDLGLIDRRAIFTFHQWRWNFGNPLGQTHEIQCHQLCGGERANLSPGQ